MSSAYVRDQIKDLLEDESAETVVDLTADFQEIKELLADNNVQPDAPWLGVQFLGDELLPISLAATNDQGCYRETGAVHFHVVAAAKIGVGDTIISRAELLQNLFIGRRIGDIVIDRLTMVNTDAGSTLQFEGGYVSGSFFVGYYRDLSL